MYQRYYGLRELPFELTPNPKFLYLTAGHREALSNLEYGLSAAKALTVLIGEAGTGKTTLLGAALESKRCSSVRCVYVNNPTLTRPEFVEMLAKRFDLGPEAVDSKTVMLERLERVLRERRAEGQITALVVDEAQSLSDELLEEIRLLANIETPDQKLLPLLLAGQPELSERLEQPELRQLKQRVALRCEVAALELPETAAYIAARIKTAGGVPSKLFTREAVSVIHDYSSGIPRTISVICDNALVSGMALQRVPVDRNIVVEVCGDFRLQRSAAGLDAAPRVDPDVMGAETDGPPSAEVAAQESSDGSDEPARTLRQRRFSLFSRR